MNRILSGAIIVVVMMLAISVGTILSNSSEATSPVLTYNSNGSNLGSVISIERIDSDGVNDTYTLKSAADYGWTWPKNAKSFAGWSTTAKGGIDYRAGDVITLSEDLKLYAVWNPFEVKVNQPSEYGSISVTCLSGSYQTKSGINYADTGSVLQFTFNPAKNHTVNHWVFNGTIIDPDPEHPLSITRTITTNTELSLFVNGQATDIYDLPEGFQAVESITNATPTTFVDTGYYPNASTSIDISFNTTTDVITESTAPLFGSRADYRFNTYTMWLKSNASLQFRSDYGTQGPVGPAMVYGASYHITMKIDEGRNKMVTTYESSSFEGKIMREQGIVDFHCPYTLYLFRINGDQKVGASYELKSMTIYEDGKQMRNFVPCYYYGESGAILDSKGRAVETGTTGFFDTIYGLFYVAEPGGELIANHPSYTMGFRVEGGTGGQDVFSYRNLVDLSAKRVNVPTSVGEYEFLGYFLNGKTMVYNSQGEYVANSLSVASNYILDAAWDSVTLNYYRNAGGNFDRSELLSSATVRYGDELTIADAPEVAPPYCTFVCWTDVDGNSYYAGETGVKLLRRTDLFAVWKEADQHMVTYFYNDDTGRSIQVVVKGEDTTTIIDAPQRSGATFYSWNTSDEGDGTDYFPGDVISTPENIQLYGKWKFTILLMKTAGSGGQESATFYGKHLPALASLPTREGFTFQGYESTNGTQYYDGNGVSTRDWDLPSGTPLLTRWAFTLTVDTGSGCSYTSAPGDGWTQVSEGKYSKQFIGTYSAEAMLPQMDPICDDNTVFLGWAGDAKHLASGATLVIEDNVTFTAETGSGTYSATMTL